ncbi:MAG: acyl-CoA dehydrogenase, partial [Bacteroidetes bacterium]|nr:acyl-CoA dehydrogenase [Bacteroidota bacterium]
EILFNIADMMTGVYSAESTLLRIRKMEQMKGAEYVELYKDIINVYLYDTAHAMSKYGHDAIYSFADEDDLENLHKGLHYYTRVPGVNVKESRRRIADRLIDENRYCF